MITQVTDDEVEGRLQAQVRRVRELEEENIALREVIEILRKAVAYYAPVCASLLEREKG
ncbi:hypothetical protein [Paraburkholderia ferrariae]|uniref:hypothetical protein n=1 Tax=Paraburkholderia ferrariae TaxID=386056 RepID=UPI00319E4746